MRVEGRASRVEGSNQGGAPGAPRGHHQSGTAEGCAASEPASASAPASASGFAQPQSSARRKCVAQGEKNKTD